MSEQNGAGLWAETLDKLRTKLGEEEFWWFADLEYLRAEQNRLFIGVPSAFQRDKLTSRYQKEITALLTTASGGELTVEFEVKPAIQPKGDSKEKVTESKIAENHPPDESPAQSVKPEVKPKKSQHPQLQENFTFDTYITGANNEFAANAAFAISRNPGKAYNPFLIYGGAGLGKTHLMQAIGNYIHGNSDHRVICVTSEDFLNEFVKSIKEGTPEAFKNKFRYTADILLIDDIQFFQNKLQIQDEFFHTFNTLLNAKKQIVLTCDRPLSELKISERLSSRFGQSLAADLQPPQYEMRCAILKATAENRGVVISDEVIDFISKNISSNVRDLIGALNTLISYTEIMKKPVTLEIAKEKLRDIIGSRWQANLSLDNIIKVVTEYFQLSSNDLKGKRKTQNIVIARQIAMYIAREITDYSTTEIGQEFGGRDHTTVMYSIDKIKTLLLTDPSIDLKIETLKRSIKEFSTKTS